MRSMCLVRFSVAVHPFVAARSSAVQIIYRESGNFRRCDPGFDRRAEIVRMVGYCSKGEKLVGMTAVRCRRSLESGIESLQRAWGVVDQDEGDEFASQEVREALQAIGEVTGEVHTNDLLDRIFSRFCIGK